MTTPPQLDKETYRTIIEGYFRAFETKDFSNVAFSSNIQFLSPISGKTFDGREAVVRFVSGVATRVATVNILYTAVDFPIAAGVWQMTTTKGVTYTLHNHFRLDGEGLLYIWPMFDPKAIISQDAPEGRGLLQWLRGTGYYEVAGTTPKQLAGVTISKTGRLFVNIPRWVDKPDPSVAEIGVDGSLLPYPNSEINQWDRQRRFRGPFRLCAKRGCRRGRPVDSRPCGAYVWRCRQRRPQTAQGEPHDEHRHSDLFLRSSDSPESFVFE